MGGIFQTTDQSPSHRAYLCIITRRREAKRNAYWAFRWTGSHLSRSHNEKQEVTRWGWHSTRYLQIFFASPVESTNKLFCRIYDSLGLGNLCFTPCIKKGRQDCANYRGISLVDIAAELFATVPLNRSVAIRNARTRSTQYGFRRGRGCTNQIFILRRKIERRYKFQQPNTVWFFGFSAGFDSVNRLYICIHGCRYICIYIYVWVKSWALVVYAYAIPYCPNILMIVQRELVCRSEMNVICSVISSPVDFWLREEWELWLIDNYFQFGGANLRNEDRTRYLRSISEHGEFILRFLF